MFTVVTKDDVMIMMDHIIALSVALNRQEETGPYIDRLMRLHLTLLDTVLDYATFQATLKANATQIEDALTKAWDKVLNEHMQVDHKRCLEVVRLSAFV